MINNTVFKIGDFVYLVTPESPKGVVVNIQYLYAERMHMYNVAFSELEPHWYYEHALQSHKSFE